MLVTKLPVKKFKNKGLNLTLFSVHVGSNKTIKPRAQSLKKKGSSFLFSLLDKLVKYKKITIIPPKKIKKIERHIQEDKFNPKTTPVTKDMVITISLAIKGWLT